MSLVQVTGKWCGFGVHNGCMYRRRGLGLRIHRAPDNLGDSGSRPRYQRRTMDRTGQDRGCVLGQVSLSPSLATGLFR